jgi:hypothetical protein
MSQSVVMRVPGKDDFINVHGMMVEKKAHHIVERIKDIDDSLEVLCVDPEQAGIFEAPFMLIEHRMTPDGPRAFKVFDFWELNESIVERVYLADTARHDVLAEIDKENARVKAAQESEHRSKMESKKDLVASIINNTKSSYSFVDEGVKKTIYEDGRPVKKEAI